MGYVRPLAFAVLLPTLLVLSGTQTDPTALAADPPARFHCSLDETCPEVMVAGDPFATLGAGQAPFRGYGDPSLEADPESGTLWLSYSWLDVLVSDPGPPPVIDFGVRTHLARSDDNGASFTFVKPLNATTRLSHPDSGEEGWTIHEVSTIVREAQGAWQTLWLTYFEALGEPPPGAPEDRSDFYYTRSVASSPDALGDESEPWIRGVGTSPSFGAQYDLSAIPELFDCVAFTEPALFTQAGSTYLATNCVVVIDGVRRDDLERLVLLREEANGYGYVGTLLSYADALDLGATRIEQVDLALSQNGAVLLMGTPILTGGSPEHLGCVVFQVTNLATAQVLRDDTGDAVQLAVITGDDSSIGPGLCTYDAASETGVLMVLHILNPDPFDLVFSLRATGIHPEAADADGDGVPDADDNCPNTSNLGQTDVDGDNIGDACDSGDFDGDFFSDQAEFFCGSPPGEGTKVPERLGNGADDDGDTSIDETQATVAGSDCDGDGFDDDVEATLRWPADDGDGGATGDETGAECEDVEDNDADTVVNDGCTTGSFGHNGPGHQERCAATTTKDDEVNDQWSADFNDDGRLNINDITTFSFPVQHMGENVDDPVTDAHARWNLGGGSTININDVSKLGAAVLKPPMFGGLPAFNVGYCPAD